jgi:hypothetical protein
MQTSKGITSSLVVVGISLSALVQGAAPAAAATCLGLAAAPELNGIELVGKNTAGCSGSPARITVYVILEWQVPPDRGWIEIAKNKTEISVGQKKTVTVISACNGTTPSGYRTRGAIYVNGVPRSSSPTSRKILPCGR